LTAIRQLRIAAAAGRNRDPEIRPILERPRDGLWAHLEAAEDLDETRREKKFGV